VSKSGYITATPSYSLVACPGTSTKNVILTPIPTITSISPNSGPTSGGNKVTILGAHLSFATSVTFGGTAATFGYNATTGDLEATAPSHVAGAVAVTVTIPNTLGVTSPGGYTYVTASTGTLTGTVQDGVTNGVISGASVSFNGSSTTTNASGVYTLTNQACFTSTLTVSKSGYITATPSYSLVACPGTSTKNVILTPIVTPSPPSAPTALTSARVSGHVSLSWNDTSTNETGFKLERRDDPSGTYAQVALLVQNQNLYTDMTAVTTAGYCYRVRATNATGDSPYSSESCIARQGSATASQHLQFSSAAYPAGPSGASVTITRTGGSSGTVAVTVLVSQGTAVAGWDYSTLGPVAVTFAPGETSKTVTVLHVLLLRVDNRTVNLALMGPTGDATLGSPSSAVMTIQGTGSTPGTISIQDPVCIQGPSRCAGGGLLTNGFPDPAKLAQFVSVNGAVADGVTLLVLSVVSSAPITFSLSHASEWPHYGTLMQVDGCCSAQSIMVNPVGSTAVAVYRAPIDLSEEVSLGVTAVNAQGNTIANGQIYLRRPPVVFIHGVWSNPDVFAFWEKAITLADGPVVWHADYRANSADTFNPFDESVPISSLLLAVETALNMERAKGIAASQVDVIAHSMGGLVARAREKDRGPRVAFKRKENRNQGEFHKLITIGTPHQGSPFADYLTKYKCGPVGAAFTGLQHPIGQAIYDFQTTSQTLALLGSTVVPSHAIAGRKPASSATEREMNVLLAPFFESVNGILGNDGEHDTQVRVSSQRGGLNDGTTADTVDGVIHGTMQVASLEDGGITETTAPGVFDVVLQALTASTTSGRFGSINDPVFRPTGTDRMNEPCFGLVFATTARAFATVIPAPGTIVRPGEVIQIVFSVPAASSSAMISIGGQVTDVTGSAGLFSTTYQLSPDVIGRITISATTLDLGASNLSADTYVVVLPSTQPTGLTPSPGSLEFAVPGLRTTLTVIGMYGDGATADLTSSASGTTYSTLSGRTSVVTVSAEGVIQAVANGQDTIIIQNGGQTASVTATVNITNHPPTLAALADTTVVAGQTVNIPLTASDPDGNSLQLSGTGLPSFVTLVDNHNGTGVLSVQPSQTDVGIYPMYVSIVDDGEPALGLSRSWQLTVTSDTVIPPPEAPKWVVPGMAYVTGQLSGTIWQSDVTIFNPDTTRTATYSVAFLDARNPVDDYSKLTWTPINVEPLGSVASGNLLGSTFGQPLGAYGALMVRGDVAPLPPVITARTFNNGDPTKGTFGLSVPPTSVSGGVSSQAPQAASVLIGLRQNADAYTNLGLVNLQNDWPKIQIDFLDGLTAAPLASRVVDMQPYQSLQINNALLDAGYAGTSDLYTVKVKILQGTAVYPWASVIDAHSTDPIVVTPTELPSNAYRIPGVVRLTGANGEHWRSRVTVSNPSSGSRKVHMVFSYVLCDTSGCAGSASLSGDLVMSPGQTQSWDDFVKVWLSAKGGVTVDDATSYQNSFLDVSPAAGDSNSDPLVVLGETYNDTPNGHVGLQVPGYTPLDGASRTGAYKRLALTGLASTTAYRTNLALFVIAGSTGKWCNVHVYSAYGTELKEIPVFVDGISQLSSTTLFGDLPGDLSRLSVVIDNIDDGVTVGGYATIIDNTSGDATFVKATPAP
jgi:pimeloyl-ACP methyl ester carboxylesterase